MGGAKGDCPVLDHQFDFGDLVPGHVEITIMELKNKTILVLGLGTTGVAVSKFAARRGAQVIGVDDAPRALLGPKVDGLVEKGVVFFAGDETQVIPWERLDQVVMSPGVPLDHLLARKAMEQNIPVIGEIELAFRFCQSPILAITGTNGKSTTTELAGALFREGGLQVSVGGNLGTPWVSLIDRDPKPDWTILEVSSFQLESIEKFRPHIAVLLNITEDHFERHRTMEAYSAAKARIFLNQGREDFFIYNDDDAHVLNVMENLPSRPIPFSSAKHVKGIYWETETTLESVVSGVPRRYSLAEAPLKGLHNIENMMAAVAAAELAGVSESAIQNGLNRFKPLPHRLEWVRELDGVRYYDDSKGTNVGAVVMSLASFDEPVILILGGKDKGGDYRVLRSLIQHKVRGVVLLGEAKEKIREALQGTAPLFEVGSMKDAVIQAKAFAKQGDVVLLSPACSSFDMFRDYKHRGDEFQRCVKEL
jgi:UDP-N-acetylmuramoylalanine--D-glutamate ligase